MYKVKSQGKNAVAFAVFDCHVSDVANSALQRTSHDRRASDIAR
jgi:hypothetical protein